MTRFVPGIAALTACAAPAFAAITVTPYSHSLGTGTPTNLLAATGMMGAAVEDFDDAIFSPFISARYNGAAASFNSTAYGGVFPGIEWFGSNFWGLGGSSPVAAPDLTEIVFGAPVAKVGIAISAAQDPTLGAKSLVVNGMVIATFQSLAPIFDPLGSNGGTVTSGLGRNGYVVFEATGGDVITSVGISAPGNVADVIVIDHVAWQVPAPAGAALLGFIPLMAGRRRR